MRHASTFGPPRLISRQELASETLGSANDLDGTLEERAQRHALEWQNSNNRRKCPEQRSIKVAPSRFSSTGSSNQGEPSTPPRSSSSSDKDNDFLRAQKSARDLAATCRPDAGPWFREVLGQGASPHAVDPDKERDPPPRQNVVIYFPSNSIDLQGTDKWAEDGRTPHLSRHFMKIQSPLEIEKRHLAALNITHHKDEPLEAFVPGGYLPPPSWMSCAKSPLRKLDPNEKQPMLLSNGVKGPEPETFIKYVRELICDTDDALRSLAHLKPKPGRQAPHINHFREFWSHLENMAQYWDDSQDEYITRPPSAPSTAPTSPSASTPKSKAKSFFSFSKQHIASSQRKTGAVYKGRRISNGVSMPEQVRRDVVRSFVRTVANLFECQAPVPRNEIKMEIGNLLIPTSYVSQVWRLPNQKEHHKNGYVEGPLVGVSARPETHFLFRQSEAYLDLGREVAALLLQAQQRAREGKPKRKFGQDRWWVNEKRWGGGEGGQFGEGEMEEHPSYPKRHTLPGNLYSPIKSEEEIWKDLAPGASPWEEKKTYLAVGKDRGAPEDTVFLVSCIFHHISFVKLRVHPSYLEWLQTERKPRNLPPDSNWHKPQMSRTQWYNLLNADDRGEAFRGLWGIIAYQMRSDLPVGRPRFDRHASHGFMSFSKSKKQTEVHNLELTHTRSHSIA